MRSPVWLNLLLFLVIESSVAVPFTISVEVVTDECISSGSSADIRVHVGSLDGTDGILTRIDGPIELNPREEANHIATGSVVTVSKSFNGTKTEADVDECVEYGHDDCFPHADVLFVSYNGDQESLSMFTPAYFVVTVEYEYKRQKYRFVYEHPMTHQCSAWFDENGHYQIGPRYGIFLRRTKMPKVGQWIRDWV